VIVAVGLVGEVQMPVHQVVDMVAMGESLMAASGAMHVMGFMAMVFLPSLPRDALFS
jgi:hypothetical protein